VGVDGDGKLYAASSGGFDKGMKEAANSLGIEMVDSKARYKLHAEENLMNAVRDLKAVGTSKRDPCGTAPKDHNCKQQLEDKKIFVDNVTP
jgi:hypothetical protein